MRWEEMRWDKVRRAQMRRSVECEECSVKCGAWRVQCEVWSVKKAMRSEKCGLWSVKCEVWSVKCEVWIGKSAVWSVKCETCSVKCGVWSVECEAWSAKWSFKCDMWNRTPLSKNACTHGLGWRTAPASSIDEKGLIYIFKATSAPPRAGTTGSWGELDVLILKMTRFIPDLLVPVVAPKSPGWKPNKQSKRRHSRHRPVDGLKGLSMTLVLHVPPLCGVQCHEMFRCFPGKSGCFLPLEFDIQQALGDLRNRSLPMFLYAYRWFPEQRYSVQLGDCQVSNFGDENVCGMFKSWSYNSEIEQWDLLKIEAKVGPLLTSINIYKPFSKLVKSWWLRKLVQWTRPWRRRRLRRNSPAGCAVRGVSSGVSSGGCLVRG